MAAGGSIEMQDTSRAGPSRLSAARPLPALALPPVGAGASGGLSRSISRSRPRPPYRRGSTGLTIGGVATLPPSGHRRSLLLVRPHASRLSALARLLIVVRVLCRGAVAPAEKY